MSKYNVLPSNRVRLMATIDPDAYTAAAYTSDWVAMKDFKTIMATIMAGTLGSSATLNAKLQEATDNAGAGAQDITGKAITELTQVGSDSDKQAIINIRDDELTDTFTHVAVVVTVGVATSDMAAMIQGFDQAYEPETDLASVDEIVS